MKVCADLCRYAATDLGCAPRIAAGGLLDDAFKGGHSERDARCLDALKVDRGQQPSIASGPDRLEVRQCDFFDNGPVRRMARLKQIENVGDRRREAGQIFDHTPEDPNWRGPASKIRPTDQRRCLVINGQKISHVTTSPPVRPHMVEWIPALRRM